MKNIIILSLFFLILFTLGCKGDEKMITLDNVDKFKETLLLELPVGASKDVIEQYLNMNNIEHSYVKEDHMFYAILPKIGRYRIIYDASLLIRIHVSDLEILTSIEFEMEYTGL